MKPYPVMLDNPWKRYRNNYRLWRKMHFPDLDRRFGLSYVKIAKPLEEE